MAAGTVFDVPFPSKTIKSLDLKKKDTTRCILALVFSNYIHYLCRAIAATRKLFD